MDRVFIAILCLCVSLVRGQIPIPKSRLGYVYDGGNSDAAVSLDIHMGPLCPDSRDTLPVAKQVATHYGASVVRLTLHMFPLPYHHNSFYAAIGARSVLKLSNLSTSYRWFDIIYDNLDKLSNTATMEMSTKAVISLLADYAHQIGVDRDGFLNTIAMPEMDEETRGAWKYSCSRGVFGTPTYFLNDVPIEADPTWSLADWQKVIDPLLQSDISIASAYDNTTCHIGTKKCEYLPHKIECCTRGEACIPNVGCRCSEETCGDLKPDKDCPSGTKFCQFLPGKSECCTKGEACIPNVGCRCWDNDCQTNQSENEFIVPLA